MYSMRVNSCIFLCDYRKTERSKLVKIAKRLSALILTIIMLLAIAVPDGLIQKAYADDDYCMKFSVDGTQYTMYPGVNGSGPDFSWTVDADGNFELRFTSVKTYTFKVIEGDITNGAVYLIGGGAGGSSGYGWEMEGHGGNGGGGGELVNQPVSVAEGVEIKVTVGKGGKGGYTAAWDGTFATSMNKQIGEAGGDTVFGSLTAAGGIPDIVAAGGQPDGGGAGGSCGLDSASNGSQSTTPRGGGGGAVSTYFRESSNANANDQSWYCPICGVAFNAVYGNWVAEGGLTAYSASGRDGGGAGGVVGSGSAQYGVNNKNGHCGSAPGAAGTDNTGGGGGGGTAGVRTYCLWYPPPVSGTGSAQFAGIYTSGGNGGSGVAKLSGHTEAKMGLFNLYKSSSKPELSDGNSCYSLAGAVYGVFPTEADARANTNMYKSVTTKADGSTDQAKIKEGSWFVKEITAAPGYALDPVIYPVSFVDKELTELRVKDTPITDPVGVILKKLDAATGTGTSAGAASLANAEFTYKFYAGNYATQAAAEASGSLKRTWVLKTDSDGFTYPSDVYKVSGDEFWTGAGGPTFPLGTLIIQETKAPEHYFIDNTVFIAHITEDGTDLEIAHAYNAPERPNTLVHGGVSVDKRDSALKDPTVPQGNASLAGAVFDIINNNDVDVTVDGKSYKKGETVAQITTNAAGHAESAKDLLPFGQYVIKETTPPEGYELNTSWSYTFNITDSDNGKLVSVGTMTDDVIRGKLQVHKTDKQTGLATPQGDATFAGAIFNVINISPRNVTYDGKEFKPNEVVTTMTTDNNGLATVGNLPYGSYQLEEVSIPISTGYTANLTFAGKTNIISSTNVSATENCPETIVVYGGVEVQKADAYRNDAIPEGDATLKGAVFEIYNASAQPVIVNGTNYNVGSLITTITTDGDGIATLNKILPIGTYTVKEKTPSKGYLLNTDWEGTAVIRTDGEVAKIEADKSCFETPITGGVSVQKIDKDTGTNRGYGGIQMKNAEFSIVNRSDKAVVYGGKIINPFVGEFDRYATYDDGVVCKIYSNEDGFATTGANDLPYGTYEIYETGHPSGYLLNEDWVKSFQIREDGKIIAFDGDDACVEELARLDIHFQKIDAVTGKTMPNVVFEITHEETGEVHYVVTDINGVFDSSSSYTPHSINTNANDAAVTKNGDEYTVDESKLNYEAGTWYGGGEPIDESPSGEMLGAFIYGHYHFKEIRCEANKGRKLVEFDKLLYAKRTVMDLGDIVDHPPEEIETTLTDGDNGSHFVTPGETVVLYDTVKAYNLEYDREYTLEATLMEKNTEAPLLDKSGNPVTATYTFVAKGSDMVIDKKIVFEFDGDLLTGSDLVCFEKLTDGAGKVYAEHEDISDQDQTVKIPYIGTTAQSEEGDKYILAKENAVIIDKVSYQNLIPNKTFEMRARLVDKATGEFLKDKSGKIIETVSSFKPTSSSGVYDMMIQFDASELKGKDIVVYEYAYLSGTGSIVASHEDITDEGQTVRVLKIGTVASNEKESENKALAAAPDTKIFDLVEYGGLEPETTYTMEGELYDAETGEKVTIPGAVATTTFTTDSTGNGSVYVEFTADTTGMEGTTFVVFERLYEGEDTTGKLLAEDAELENLPETLYIPEIHTTATTEDGTHTAAACENVTINDEVFYTNLYPGQEYKMEGKLVDGDTGVTLKDAAGKDITAETVFTPEEPDGSVIITFTIDATDLAGKSAVAFETLNYKNLAGEYKYLTEHSDLDDEDQTISFPAIRTNAASVDGIQVIKPDGTVTIRDTVHVSNATVDTEYIFRGRIVDSDGNELSGLKPAETTVTAKSANFDAVLEFQFDTAKFNASGKTFTVYEKMYEHYRPDGGDYIEREIASHEEIMDEDQTVWFPKISTTASDETGNKLIKVDEESDVTIKDVVTYTTLKPGSEYIVTGTLMDKATGAAITDESGNAITADATFTPDDEDGSVEITFTVKGSVIAGKTAVAFEEVTLNGIVVAEHKDINSSDQTVYFPVIGTTATNGHGTKSGAAAEESKIVDTVEYSNLIPGLTYKVEGYLVDKATGSTIVTVAGDVISASKEFKAKTNSGTVDVEFNFGGTALAGNDIVVFETISVKEGDDYREIAEHKDINDESQTIYFPKIRTNATTVEGIQVANPYSDGKLSKDIVIKDTVHVTNAILDTQYVFEGKIVDAEGNDLSKFGTVKATTTAIASDFDIILEFHLDAEKYAAAGNSFIVYEKLYERAKSENGKTYNDYEVASHEEIDADQTIWFPEIRTTAVGEDGEKLIGITDPDEEITITDTVEYKGLQPGVEYEMTGILMNKETEAPILNSESEPITATKNFVPETADGTLDLELKLTGKDIAGSIGVVYETIKLEGITVAEHNDINDEDQTVYAPDIRTTATTEAGSHTAPVSSKEITINDMVFYNHLLPGKEYKLEGKLMDKATGETLKDAAGAEITAEKTFTPESESGAEIISFTFVSSECAGLDAVAFETLSFKTAAGEYKFITEHSDIDDEEQTVHFPSIRTNAASVEGIQVIKPEGTVTVKDTVHVTNAVPDSTYKFIGTLVDSEGNELKGVSSEPVTVTAETADFDVEVQFTFDAAQNSLAAGTSTVYEKMVEVRTAADGKKTYEVDVAEHSELTDKDQTIWYPEIKTTATGKDGEKLIEFDSFDEEVTIIDTVEYKGLQPGKEYIMTGTLVYKETGKDVTDDAGKTITASRTFTPETGEGTVEIEFHVLASILAGNKVVAFERLTTEGVLVAVHEDINDAAQTLEFGSIGAIYKYDATTEKPLPGAVITVTDKTTGATIDVTTDKNGIAKFVTYGGHEYTFSEKSAPDGYDLNKGVFTFKVKPDGTMEGDTDLLNMHTGTVVLTKTNEQTKEPVEGATIAVFKKEGNSYTELFRQTTDKYGRIYFWPDNMTGTLYYREVAAPAGYYLDDDMHSFTIKPDFSVTGQTSFVNAQRGTVVLKKMNESGNYLAGARFGVYNIHNQLIAQAETDVYGRMYFVSPGPGSYYFMEMMPPQGYLKNENKNYFSIDANGVVNGTTVLTDRADPSPRTGDELGSDMWLGGTIVSSTLSAAAAVLLFILRKRKTV